MALLQPGFWPSQFWQGGFWPEDFWPDYGTPIFIEAYRRIFIKDTKRKVFLP